MTLREVQIIVDMDIMRKVLRKLNICIHRLYYIYCCPNIALGHNFNFRSGFVMNYAREARITIGDNNFFNNWCSLNVQYKLKIGDNCIFGEGVKIYDHNHKFNKANVPVFEQGFSCKCVEIGNNCWIGSNVIILAGAKIGDNVVIGAGCTIDRTIESNRIVRNRQELYIDKIDYK
ncbi:MAG: acyltransferase [Enterocloster asparagiformis]|nr:acyltransferase [Enterocloster asparagiformis]